ncbi:MAG: Lrp/AsnC ligand binding domain-containing protein [Candidatus Dormibacteria bacterium]
MVTAFLQVICEPGAIPAVGQGLADTPGIAEVYTTTGSADFVAIVRVADLDELATLVTERITTLPGVTRTTTAVAIRSYGRSDEATAFDIGVD